MAPGLLTVINIVHMNLEALCDDLLAERAESLGYLDEVGDDWGLATPAPGWSVLDQVTHLAWVDEAATMAIVDPDAFCAMRSQPRDNVESLVEASRSAHHGRSNADVRNWLITAGDALIAAARAAEPGTRIPWFGPNMTVASSITARIMETWAHTQDIVDALGSMRVATPRLQHVAFIGWRALPFSFAANQRQAPTEPVRVELGDITLGPDDATNVVRGSALDFCLLVTQRRHLADTDLRAEGPVAAEWLTIAQAFAGPPGGMESTS